MKKIFNFLNHLATIVVIIALIFIYMHIDFLIKAYEVYDKYKFEHIEVNGSNIVTKKITIDKPNWGKGDYNFKSNKIVIDGFVISKSNTKN